MEEMIRKWLRGFGYIKIDNLSYQVTETADARGKLYSHPHFKGIKPFKKVNVYTEEVNA